MPLIEAGPFYVDLDALTQTERFQLAAKLLASTESADIDTARASEVGRRTLSSGRHNVGYATQGA